MAHTLGETVGETVGLRVRFGSKVSARDPHRGRHRRRVHPHDPRRSGARRASPRCCSTNSTSARSMPTWAWRWRATRSRACARTCKILVMSATLDGARVARAARRRAGDRERRAAPFRSRRAISAAIRARRSSDQVADAVLRALRRRAGLGAGLPARRGRNPPHRDAAARARRRSDDRRRRALRRARCRHAGPRHRAGAAGPPQGRARDLDRRDLAHHRGRARRGRLRARARAALRAGRRADAARNRARLARRRRPAPRPRRPHRAGHLLPAVGRAADRRARALCAARKSSPPTCRPSCSISAHWGAATRRRSPSSIRRRRARSPRRSALLAELGALDADGRITEEGRALRRAAAAAAARAHGGGCGARRRRRARRRHRRRADRARARRRRRRSRATASRVSVATARAAPRTRDAMAQRWRASRDFATGRACPLPRSPGTAEAARRSAQSSRSPIRTASRKSRGAAVPSCWPTAAAANIDPASALAREPFLVVAELTGNAAQGRILLAAPITSTQIEARFADRHREQRRGHVRRCERQRCARAASRRLGAIALAEQTRRSRRPARPHALLADGIAASAWTAAVDQGAAAMARPRDVPASRGGRTSGPTCPTRRSLRAPANGSCRSLLGKTRCAGTYRRRACERPGRPCCRGRCAAGSRPKRRPISRRRRARGRRSTTRRRPGPRCRSACRNCSASTAIPPSPAGRVPLVDRTVVAGAPAGAGDARPAGLLARLLRGGEGGDERPLPEASLARGSALVTSHAPRQARRKPIKFLIRFIGASPSGQIPAIRRSC